MRGSLRIGTQSLTFDHAAGLKSRDGKDLSWWTLSGDDRKFVTATAKIKGDTVVVIAGRDRGKSGKVLSVDRSAGKVIVEKLNMIKRHTKPNQKVKQGGILEREAPFAVSNVMYLCPVTQKPTRLGVRRLDEGRRVRFSKKSNDSVE